MRMMKANWEILQNLERCRPQPTALERKNVFVYCSQSPFYFESPTNVFPIHFVPRVCTDLKALYTDQKARLESLWCKSVQYNIRKPPISEGGMEMNLLLGIFLLGPKITNARSCQIDETLWCKRSFVVTHVWECEILSPRTNWSVALEFLASGL